MSFDLIVIELNEPLRAQQVLAKLESKDGRDRKLMDENPGAKTRPLGRLGNFYDMLTSEYPDLDDAHIDDERVPWTVGLLGPWDDHIDMHIAWSRAQDVPPAVIKIAAETGVSVLHLGALLVYHPPRITSATGTMINCAHLFCDVHGYPELVRDLVAFLPEKQDPYLIIERSDEVYLQTLWSDAGWLIEHRAGSADEHYAITGMTSAATADALCDYLIGADAWHELPFVKKSL